MVLAVKLLVTFIKVRIFFFKHDDDMLGEIANSILGGLFQSITDLIGGKTDEAE